MKTKNKVAKIQAGKSSIEDGNKEQSAVLLRQERIKKLQRKKDAPKLSKTVEEFIVDVLYGNKWQPDHLDKVPKEDRNRYLSFLQGTLGVLAFEDRDRLLDRIENVLNGPTKNNIWEVEHVNIVNAVDTLTREKNRLAARCEISEKTGLSQKTIEKHIGEYFQSHPHIAG